MASELLVNKITPESGTTLTLGDSGDTISFASGVLPSLESLTITGDLTVDTNTLYVDSSNNKVVMGSTSRYGYLNPFLEVTKATTTSTEQGFASFNLFGGTGVRRPFVFLNRSRGSTEGNFTAVSSGDLLGTLAFGGSDGTEFIVSTDINGEVDGTVSTGTVPTALTFKTSNTERMRIDSSGHAIIPEGVTLGTSAGTYLASNTLDDYEEGTWTPAYQAATTAFTSVTYDQQQGTYIKVGNKITLWFRIRTDALSGGSGTISIVGLPFAPDGTGGSARVDSVAGTALGADWIGNYPTHLSIPVGVSRIDIFSQPITANVIHLTTGNMRTGTNDNLCVGCISYYGSI